MRVGYIAPLSPTGYGSAALGYIRAIHEAGVDINLSLWTEYRQKGTYEGDDEQLIRELLSRSEEMRVCDTIIHHKQPDVAKPVEDKYNICYTVFEANVIPSLWVQILNSYFQEVWVPSEFNVTSFRNSGVRIPITKIPHIVKAEPLQSAAEPIALNPQDFEGKVLFLFIGTWDQRKNPDGLLTTYYETFSAQDNTLLVCRTHLGTHGAELQADTIARIKKAVPKEQYPPVIILGENLPQQDIIWLHQQARVFTSLAYSEGWGLGHSQSLAAGVPVLSNNWGGSLEYQNEENSFLVDTIKIGPVTSSNRNTIYNPFLMSWGYPDLKHASKLLRRALEEPALCQEKGRAGQKDMKQYNSTTIGELIQGRLRDIPKT